MNSNNAQTVDTLPRIKSVTARAPWTLHVTWVDRKKDQIDLTGLIHRSRHFRVFLNKPAAFPHAIRHQQGRLMADEQRPVSGADLVIFESELGLSTAETAALLGLAERTIRAYRNAKRLPQSVAIAIRTIRASNTVLAAHYRPAGHRARGRPKKKEVRPRAA